MKLNDADYFSWVANHLWQVQYGLRGMTIKYINNEGGYSEYYYNYLENNIEDVSKIDDDDLLRRVIDKIIQLETDRFPSENRKSN